MSPDDKPLPLRSIMRAMLIGKVDKIDSDRTYTYSDRQVINLFQFAIIFGVLAGGLTTAAILGIIGN